MNPRTPLSLLLPQPRPVREDEDERDLVELYDDCSRAPRFTDPAQVWVRANMVASLDGEVMGPDGRSGSISSPADKRVFSVLRSLADAVVVGGGTARSERYTRLRAKPAHAMQRRDRGQQPVPALVLLSRSGDVDLDRLDEAGSSPVLVHASAAHISPDRARQVRSRLGSDALVLHEDQVEPGAVLGDLAARGMRRVLHEGGPGMLGAWVAAGCLDELCLTVSPVLAGTPGQGATGQGAPGQGTQRQGTPRSVLGDTGLETLQRAVPLSLLTDGTTLIQRWGLSS